MARILRIGRLAAAGAALAWSIACASSSPAGPTASAPNPAAKLAAMFGGRFEGVTPGSQLHLNIESVVLRTLSHPYDMFLEVTGRYQNTNVHQEGYLHLANQGRDVARTLASSRRTPESRGGHGDRD